MSVNRTHLSACASALAAACLLAAGSAHADWPPTKTAEIVVAAGPGGGTDHLARLIPPLCVSSKTRMSYTARAHGVFQDAGWLVK
jgi:tripartite-type tricarboxylate transporter receptor subunit TctC